MTITQRHPPSAPLFPYDSNFVLKMMTFMLQMMDCVLQMMDFVLKMMDFGADLSASVSVSPSACFGRDFTSSHFHARFSSFFSTLYVMLHVKMDRIQSDVGRNSVKNEQKTASAPRNLSAIWQAHDVDPPEFACWIDSSLLVYST